MVIKASRVDLSVNSLARADVSFALVLLTLTRASGSSWVASWSFSDIHPGFQKHILEVQLFFSSINFLTSAFEALRACIWNVLTFDVKGGLLHFGSSWREAALLLTWATMCTVIACFLIRHVVKCLIAVWNSRKCSSCGESTCLNVVCRSMMFSRLFLWNPRN